MEDHLQVRVALETNSSSLPQPPPEPSVSFNASTSTTSVEFDTAESLHNPELEPEGVSARSLEMEGPGSSSDEYTTSLLPKTRVENSLTPRSCLTECCAAYRPTDSGARVTPFAIILLVVLLVIYVLNQADRLVLAVLIPSGLRCWEDFENSTNSSCSENQNDILNNTDNGNITDCVNFNNFEQGLLTGPAFTVIYVVAGLPLAWLADTASRPLVLLIGLAFWSTMMVLSGSVVVFWELLVLRVMLGVGEVSLHKLIFNDKQCYTYQYL